MNGYVENSHARTAPRPPGVELQGSIQGYDDESEREPSSPRPYLSSDALDLGVRLFSIQVYSSAGTLAVVRNQRGLPARHLGSVPNGVPKRACVYSSMRGRFANNPSPIRFPNLKTLPYPSFTERTLAARLPLPRRCPR